MQRFRITKAPATPDNPDTARVPGHTQVRNSWSGVEREDANLEAEGGESVVGDVNGDGMLEHMFVQGPSHAKGGVPLNVPEGSFIFSNSRKLRVKDEEVLEHFGQGENSKGKTPAELAKRFEINPFIDVLKSKDADQISKSTAQLMLKNNTQKLGELAMLQEQLKGLPNGVPALAEQAMPEMEFGGAVLPEFQEGGRYSKVNQGQDASRAVSTTNPSGPISRPRVGQKIYLNGEPVKVVKADLTDVLDFRNEDRYIELSNGHKFTQAEWNKINSQPGGYDYRGANAPGTFGKPKSPQIYATTAVKPTREIDKGLSVKKGDYLRYSGNNYDVVNPFGIDGNDSSGIFGDLGSVLTGKYGDGFVQVRNRKTKELETLSISDLKKLRSVDPEAVTAFDPYEIARQREARKRAPAPTTTAPEPATAPPATPDVSGWNEPVAAPVWTPPVKARKSTPAYVVRDPRPQQHAVSAPATTTSADKEDLFALFDN